MSTIIKNSLTNKLCSQEMKTDLYGMCVVEMVMVTIRESNNVH